ncbi:MAG: di-trans,poly-cis-decaprenylcistransferase [Polyangiaceae bacterium]|nr:di-trans,poly-cis-decaprenylcistransferase [Polyangiaceae bacterium]
MTHAQSNLPRPTHVGIILDGNGRWATARGLTRTRGHEAGAVAVRKTVLDLLERNVPCVTLYAFSAQNWSRPKEEVDTLMRIVLEFAEEMREPYIEAGISVVTVGDIDELPTPTRRAVERMVRDTSASTRMKLALALSYGGRRDVIGAMRAIAVRARAGLLIPEEIDETSVREFLSTSAMPDADLIIRTGGDRRLSDFLLFEAAYAELFFTEVLWPDFNAETLDLALGAYGRRRLRSRRTQALAAAG